MTQTIIHLVRHGEVHNPDKILYGRLPDYHLSELGTRMAERAGEYLKDRDLVFIAASPLERAHETAAPIAAHHNLAVHTDPRLIEASNHFEGHRVGHGEASFSRPGNWKYFLNPFRPSWGEPYRHQVERVMAAVHDARAAAAGHEAALVLHQLPIWLTRRAMEGKPLLHDPRRRQCGLASLTSLVYDGDTLTRVDYAEPSADLYTKAVDATGGKLT